MLTILLVVYNVAILDYLFSVTSMSCNVKRSPVVTLEPLVLKMPHGSANFNSRLKQTDSQGFVVGKWCREDAP